MAADKNLQELHKPIDIEIVRSLFSVIPETWWSLRLDVEYVCLSDDEEYSVSITNIEGEKDIVVPPDEIYTLIHQHSELFKKHGKQWQKLIYNLTYDENQEDWKYEIDYKY